MNIEDLTIKQARELCAMFAGLSPEPAAAAPPILHRAGEPVMIRDHLAGLLVGRLATDHALGASWALMPGARKIHYWSKAAGPEGAALCGPGPGSRVCPPASRPRGGCNLVEIVGLTADELGAILAYPVWTP